MELKVIIILSISILLTNCSKKEKNYILYKKDGISIFKNSVNPSNPNYTYSIKKLFKIVGNNDLAKDSLSNFSYIHFLTADSSNNLYVLNYKTCEIKKFNSQGKFLKTFGKKGNGPGEFLKAWQMFIFRNRLYISDYDTRQYSIFNLDGEFINRLSLDGNDLLDFPQKVGKDKIFALVTKWSFNDNSWQFQNELNLFDKNLKKLKTFKRTEKIKFIPGKTNMHNYISPFAVSEDKIFIGKNSFNEYRIDVFSFEGEKLYEITKSYRKLTLSKNELNSFKKSRKNSTPDSLTFQVSFKKAINTTSMFIDKFGNLIVQVPVERTIKNQFDFIVDSFNSGIFVNRFKINRIPGYDFYNSDQRCYFINNRVYHADRVANEITVFEY